MTNIKQQKVTKPRGEKLSAFNKTFNEPVHYSENNEYYLSSELYNKEQALEVFRKFFAEGYDKYIKTFTIDDVYDDRVRWCCQYDYDEGVGRAAWWSGATGKGSKPCWFIKLKYKKEDL